MTSIYNSTTTTLLVDTTSARKIVFLPVASTVGAGRLLWIKDISGNAATNGIYISTIGMDRIENRSNPSTLFAVMSTSYASVMMTTDGILNWYFLQHYYRNAISIGATGGSATGGTITTPTISGTSYTIHTFTTVGTTSFIVSGSIACDYLVVAGGGGGGTGRGGGGGGGGVLQGSITLTTGTYTITVGDRGNNSVNDLQGGDGGSSSIGALVVTTGGGGGGGWITNAGRNGGSGGGASAGSAASGGTGVAGQGFAGSARLDGNTGGGGGGAGAAASGSTGAIGITSMITGTATNYAGGGGAGAVTGGAIGVAFGGTYQVANGTFGGGNGANTNGTKQSFQDAVANTGGGGGGQEGFQGNSGFGGTGIVIIRYPTSFTPRLISGLQVWLDGKDPAGTGTAPANAATISTWVDKSGNGYNFTASVAATYSSAYTSVSFANSLYSSSYTAAPTSETAFIVFNYASGGGGALVAGYSGARGIWCGNSGGGANSVGIVNTLIAWLAVTSSGTTSANTTTLTTARIASGSSFISLNGSTTFISGGTGFTGGTVTWLGREAGTSFGYTGYAMEIIFFNSDLSLLNRQKVEGYLAWKWGSQASLAAGHPYLSAPP
jgi:hypothetical protein